MKTLLTVSLCSLCLATATAFGKPDAQEAAKMLADGNARFVAGSATHPRSDMKRATLAAKSDQADYAMATLVSCSDSRVPPEILFDTGIMDLFMIRVAGNVCSSDEIGSAEYGVFHAKTPLLIVMGHSKCGAVTAVVKATKGEGHALEKNIPPLVAPVGPAVQKVLQAFPQATMDNLIIRSTEENVWQGVENIFLRSAAIREAALAGKVKVMGAIYDLESGKVRFLSDEKCAEVLKNAEASPTRETQKMAGGGGHHEESKEAAEPAKAASAHEAAEKEPVAHAEPAEAPAHH
ncbi:MAG: carbonic anhydrase [Magnetococcus sp. WYHC-3]